MTTIGIIGASGQVGTEVCLFLKTYSNIRPVAIVRTPISGALLRRLGIEVRCGGLGTSEQCKELIGDCDLVVDFSLPAGETQAVKAHYLNNISKALAHSRPAARYVFISSIDAFGMSAKFSQIKHHWLPHSTYALTKRFGERMAASLGSKLGKEAFVFRFGHVHGLLQRVSADTAEMVGRNYRDFEFPDSPSYTIFCHSIAEAIVRVSEGRAQSGSYVLISEPAWSWKELLEHYAKGGREIRASLRAPTERNIWRRFVNGIKGDAIKMLYDYRETLRANLLPRFPELERKSAAYYYTRRASQQIMEYQSQYVYRPDRVHSGRFPGQRFPGLSDSRQTMLSKAALVQEMLTTLSEEAFHTGVQSP